MAFMDWKEEFNLDIEIIDNQHKKLVEMINNFYNLLNKKSNNELIGELIKEMKDYTVVHFSTEEAYFKKLNYKNIKEHSLEHKLFVDKVADLETRFNNKKLILSFEITNFLKDWLINHILGSDKKYVELFKSNGIN